MRLSKTILGNKALIAIIDQGVFSGTNFIVTIGLAHLMASASFGILASITLIVYLLIGSTNALIVQPLQVMIAHVDLKKQYIDFNIWCQVLIVVALSIVALFVSLILPKFEALYPAIAFGATLLVFDSQRKILLANDNPIGALAIDSIVGVTQLIGLLMVYLSTSDLSRVMITLAFSYLIGAVAGWLLMKPSLRIDKKLWRSWLDLNISQGKWLLVASTVQWGAANLFVVMSGIYLGPSSLGAFRVVQSLFGVINLLFQSFENYMIPTAARLLQQSKEDARKYLLKVGIRSVGIFGVFLGFLFVFADQFIVIVGGDQYSCFGFVVQGMALLYLVILLGYPVRMAIRILIMPKQFFSGYLFSFVFSLLTSWFLLTNFGLTGAIAGLIVNQVIIIITWQYFLNKKEFRLWKSFT